MMREVTLDEALSELGVDRAAGADGARRAYLRLLKTRKPETDPDGFMRLREAYELVKSDLAFWESFHAAAASDLRPWAPPEPRRAEPPPKQEPKGAAIPVPEVAPVDPPPPAPPIEPPPPDEATAEDAAPEENAPEEDAPEEDAPDAALDDVAIDEWTLDALIRANKHIEAAAGMTALFRAAAARLDGPTPPVAKALRLLLALHAKNAIAEALDLKNSFAAWLAASGQEARLLRGESAVRWTLVRELDALPSSLPASVRAAIAESALDGDLTNARPALTSFRVLSRSAALSAGGLLRRKAPTIAAAVADTLDPPAPQVPSYSPPGTQQRSKAGAWMILVVLAGLLRILAAVGRSSTPSYTPSYNYNVPPLPNLTVPKPFFGLDGGFRIPARLDELRSTVLSRAYAVESMAALDDPELSKKATAIAGAIEQRDCAAALSLAKQLSDQAKKGMKKPGAEQLGTQMMLLDLGVRNYCDELAMSGGVTAGGAAGVDAGRSAEAGRAAPARSTKVPSAAAARDAGPCGGAAGEVP